jgi:hypothetical protein
VMGNFTLVSATYLGMCICKLKRGDVMELVVVLIPQLDPNQNVCCVI